ncbi:hypothetical protein AMTRI_Chr10g226560 [Amborella trichopoda]
MKATSSIRLVITLLFFYLSFTSTEAYDALDPNGNITIKWDVMSWTPDGYVAVVSIYNLQQFRHIGAPGWTLGWTWSEKEVIWSMVGAQTTKQGDCSRFKGNIPHSCEKGPEVVDLLPGTPFNQQIANCCKGGVLSSMVDPENTLSAFQLSVGAAGTSKRTVLLPKNFTLIAPGPGYTCGPAKAVTPTRFITPDGRRVTQALMTWNVTCTYSQFLAHKTPTCCVSLSSFYNHTVTPCPTCSCNCGKYSTQPGRCIKGGSSHSTPKENQSPMVQCTNHMCPVQVHWHLKLDFKDYWSVMITITNFNYHVNYTEWNLVIQNPNFNNLIRTFNSNYKSFTPYGGINDTAVLWGVKKHNDILLQAGRKGFIQSKLIFKKNTGNFTPEKRWAFPRRVYFNGDICVLPRPDAYPWLPPSSHP